ncbi:MAG: hypothetical protein HYZ28_22910 [Myxococcales bacterium]|nr:hypothetical protein [Myxococcales bacterium]
MRSFVLSALALAGAGCLTPRSAVLGQTASPIGLGASEVALSTGFAYQSQSAPPAQATDAQGRALPVQSVARGFGIPAFEANGQIGLADAWGLNLHASAAGLQPGAKWTLNKGPARLALMPQVGLGYSSSAASTFATGADGRQTELSPQATTSLVFLAGLKVLASHRSGVYGGVGYDFQSLTSVSTQMVGQGGAAQKVESSTGWLQHNIALALGYEWKLEWVRLRPEVAAIFTPAISSHVRSGQSVVEAGGGHGFLLFPSLTFAIATQAQKTDAGAEEDERRLQESEEEDEPL